jgi:hypothetical protein
MQEQRYWTWDEHRQQRPSTHLIFPTNTTIPCEFTLVCHHKGRIISLLTNKNFERRTVCETIWGGIIMRLMRFHCHRKVHPGIHFESFPDQVKIPFTKSPVHGG